MRIATSLVVVGSRIRKDVDRNIQALCRSINELGQLQPILIDEQNNLIAGARRLRACELLERDVDAVVPDSVDDALKKLKAERDENQCREGFNPEEAVAAGKAIEAWEKPKAADRMEQGGKKAGRGRPAAKSIGSENFSDPIPDAGNTRDKVAEAVGMSGPTYDKAKEVVEAAEADPKLRPIVDEMNASGKVDPAHKKVRAAKGVKPPKKKGVASPSPDDAIAGVDWVLKVAAKNIVMYAAAAEKAAGKECDFTVKEIESCLSPIISAFKGVRTVLSGAN